MRRNNSSTQTTRSASCQAARLLVAAGISFAFTSVASATNVTNFDVVTQTDWTYAGLGGMRDNGTGSINISGVSGSVTKAYLLWGGPTDSSNLNANANVTFNGNGVTGSFIGSADSLCWGTINSLAYRADVTPFVTGNGSYSLNNFFKSANNVNVNGASLVVFYNDGNNANNRDVYLSSGYDSNQSNGSDADGMFYTENNVNFTGGTATMVLGVSDGQEFPDGPMTVNGNPVAAQFDGTSVPGIQFGQSLWDIEPLDITSNMSVGLNNITFREESVASDCLAIYFGAIDVAAVNVPEPVSISVLALGGAVALLRRR
ncbi:MAG TPA: PEP-CTERM sorting domain-containing protein [Tepidisphaeraceae bacterium]|nr:PEP-CTERM sorting domain-containing protein [Tepidisphaeraceae bacterium]